MTIIDFFLSFQLTIGKILLANYNQFHFTIKRSSNSGATLGKDI